MSPDLEQRIYNLLQDILNYSRGSEAWIRIKAKKLIEEMEENGK